MEFKNIDIIKAANVYFDGKVNSRNIFFMDGTKKTLGFMQAGEYEFNTAMAEVMEVLNGEMKIKREDDSEFVIYKSGESFSIKANSSFKIIVEKYADYCCSYCESL
ncbi:pyrimidine/purine nucleoside phosphorylase [Cetobacterium sp. 2A]|uniref:pyrimidine/purine nucleoside phosphorylase n=1 Tax=unclassified Cetobacterium TaxID=2630983 RepID=UPI00163BE715|nr:pyrimidine/purine nucleoside phosphorylase [Cetobacterium sp. 2A]MBC2857117.1 pyrimidine/purine nucleoside phosphorylase [Cetobacterium sp. 2A]